MFGGSWIGVGLDSGPNWGKVGSQIHKNLCRKKHETKMVIGNYWMLKILGQSEAWELLNVNQSEKSPCEDGQERGSGEYEGYKTPQDLMRILAEIGCNSTRSCPCKQGPANLSIYLPIYLSVYLLKTPAAGHRRPSPSATCGSFGKVDCHRLHFWNTWMSYLDFVLWS